MCERRGIFILSPAGIVMCDEDNEDKIRKIKKINP